jgi:hypothetical protein
MTKEVLVSAEEMAKRLGLASAAVLRAKARKLELVPEEGYKWFDKKSADDFEKSMTSDAKPAKKAPAKKAAAKKPAAKKKSAAA